MPLGGVALLIRMLDRVKASSVVGMAVGLLLPILFGSVVGIWAFDRTSTPGDYAVGATLALAGCATAVLLSGIRA